MPASITPRQREVLARYAEVGLQKEVARQMGLSTQTVKNQLGRAYRKIGADNAIEAYRLLGWLSVPEAA